MTVDNPYPNEPAVLLCPTCGRAAIHDRHGCQLCRAEALDRLIDAVAQAEATTNR